MSFGTSVVKRYMEHGFNILIEGEAGTGKTSAVSAAAQDLGLTMKSYSSGTLDPFADLLGIPVPNMETRHTEYFRPAEIDEAEVVFFDELNRADEKVRNAVLEVIQFRTINGEPLPKLKACIAAINPSTEDYDVDRLDQALIDRFDVYLESEVVIDYSYFKRKYGAAVAKVVVRKFDEYQTSYRENREKSSRSNTMGFLSPRRMEKVLQVYLKVPTEESLRLALPNDVVFDVRGLKESLESALDPKTKQMLEDFDSHLEAQLKMPLSEITKSSNREQFREVYITAKTHREKDSVAALRKRAAKGLSIGVGPKAIIDKWSYVINDFDYNEIEMMQSPWSTSKIREFTELLREN